MLEGVAGHLTAAHLPVDDGGEADMSPGVAGQLDQGLQPAGPGGEDEVALAHVVQPAEG